MVTINENYLKLSGGYLFTEIGQKVAKFKAENPEASVIRLGIGDVEAPSTNSNKEPASSCG